MPRGMENWGRDIRQDCQIKQAEWLALFAKPFVLVAVVFLFAFLQQDSTFVVVIVPPTGIRQNAVTNDVRSVVEFLEPAFWTYVATRTGERNLATGVTCPGGFWRTKLSSVNLLLHLRLSIDLLISLLVIFIFAFALINFSLALVRVKDWIRIR